LIFEGIPLARPLIERMHHNSKNIRKKMIKKLFVIGTFLTLAGCATTYIPPAKEGNAEVNFSKSSFSLFRLYENGEDCGEPRVLAPADNPFTNKSKSFVVHANKRFAFEADWFVEGGKFCSILFALTPQANKTYFLKGSVDEKQCRINIIDEDGMNAFNDPAVNAQQMKYVLTLVGVQNKCAPK
jgi:hypothetical protein